MNRKNKTPAKPKDERKLFFAASYKLEGTKLKFQNFVGKENTPVPFDTQEDALKAAQDFLSQQRSSHYTPDGVLVFESIALVKPKKIEVEIESFPIEA